MEATLINKLNKKVSRQEAINAGTLTISYRRVHKNKKAYSRKNYRISLN
jgi:hypothetical protein